MPLAQPLAELRQNLEAQIREGQLPDALNALLAHVPDGSETYRIVSALIARINAANKERYRNTISSEEYQRRVDQVSADFFDLLAGLTEGDFEVKPASSKATAGKQGSVLYRVPHVMAIQKPVRCTIRVAVNEDAILENIVLDEHVEVKSRIEISDVMSAELVDPEGGTFQINPMNKHTQLIKETGYTEWNFNVTPLIEGVHQLLVKVSIMEVVPGFAEPIPREVSLMETVTIVTEGKAPIDTPSEEFKPSGQTFAFQSTSTAQGYNINYSKSIELPPESPSPTMPKSYNRSLRALSLLLAFLGIASAATYAIAPDFPAYMVAIIQDSPEAYADFIENHPNSPRIEKAYYYRAEVSGRLADLRLYQEKFQNRGKYETHVLGRIAALETKSLESIRERPDSLKIRQFVSEFPESERLAEVKQAVEARTETRQELLAEVENAYVTSVKARPSETKVVAYLRDFPKQERLDEVDAAARSKPEVFQKVQPILEDAYLKKMEGDPTQVQSEQFMKKFPEPVRREKFEKILEKKPGLKKEAVEKMRKLEEARGNLHKTSKIEGSQPLESLNPPPDTSSPEKDLTRTRRSGFEVIFVEGGTYNIGSPNSDKDADIYEKPSQKITLRSFSIGKYEVTQADWREIMGRNPSANSNCDECPVERVSWDDIQGFLKKLNAKYPGKNYRLPTESEWEYAARGGNKSKGYRYAGSNTLGEVAWYQNNSKNRTHPVGEKTGNELDLFDMSGNVWEWCQDKWHDNYEGIPSNGTTAWISGGDSNFVHRGGSWGNAQRSCRVANRDRNFSDMRNGSLGFRLARSN